MGPGLSHRDHRARRNRFALLDAYPVRIMLGLAASLGVLVLCFRLPLYDPPSGVGWGPASAGPPITLKDVREAEGGTTGAQAPPGAPITSFGATDASLAEARTERGHDEEPTGTDTPEEPNSPAEDSPTEGSSLTQLPGVVPLHTLDQKPHAIGGIGGVYLKIDYPEAARLDRIEGRLLLRFVVEEDGSTSHVQVAQSLHPLCDSAAVRAVERTRFMPGRRGGETVRVAMQLPVRFELVGGSPLQADRSPSDEVER